MLHKTVDLKATTTTDLGEFTAIAAAYSVDRGNERIIPGAFEATIANWQASGKQIPLHWNHSGEAADIIGTVDPMQMKETDAGLMVSGKLDLKGSEVAKEAWRSMKANALSLSFGYMVTDGAEAKDGTYELKAVDLFEVTVTPSPMNPDTRFLNLKSIEEVAPPSGQPDLADLEARLEKVENALKNVKPPLAEVEDVRDEDREATPEASDPEADEFDMAWLNALSQSQKE